MARRWRCTTAVVKAWNGARCNPRLRAQRSVSEHRAVAVNLLAYQPRQVGLGRGRGSRVWKHQGREYLDLSSGIAVNVLGTTSAPRCCVDPVPAANA